MASDRKWVMVERKEVKGLPPPPVAPMARRLVKRSKTRKSGGKKVVSYSLPPVIDQAPTCTNTFRYLSFGTTAAPVTVNNLIQACGGIVTVVNTTMRAVATSVKLHRIRIWPAGNGFASCVWGPTANIGKDVIKDETTPTGVQQSGMLQFIPPRSTLWGDWLMASTDACFILTSGTGTVVDVCVSWTQSAAFQPASVPISAGGLNTFGYLALDGITSRLYRPVVLTELH